MKVSLYLEGYHFLGGIMFRNIGTGLLSSYKNQRRVLTAAGIPFVEKWEPSADIFQVNTPWAVSLWYIKKAKRRGQKVIIWSHVTAEDFRAVFRFGTALSPLMKKYLTYAYGLADAVFCPSSYTKSLLIAYGLPEEKLIVVSNGVDIEKFYKDENKRLATRERYKLGKLTVGTLSLVIPRKGIATFLRLAKEFPGVTFVWFGKIYNALLVERLPKDLPPNVIFTGHVDDSPGALNAMDIFLFPSIEENQGMAILEAAAVGLPILVRDIPVYRDWLTDGETCLKAKAEEDFSRQLSVLVRDAAERERLAQNAYNVIRRDHSLAAVGEKAKQAYERLLA